jgi:hypothetical protein
MSERKFALPQIQAMLTLEQAPMFSPLANCVTQDIYCIQVSAIKKKSRADATEACGEQYGKIPTAQDGRFSWAVARPAKATSAVMANFILPV